MSGQLVMNRSISDLLVVGTCAIMAGTLAVLAPDIFVFRLMFGLPLVLVLPGYALAAALFARQSLGVSERILFSVGLSLLVDIIGGLIVGSLHWRLQNGTWAVLLVGITLGASITAGIRRKGSITAPSKFHLKLNARESLLLGLAVMVTLGAIGLARTPVPAKDVEGYTFLWMQTKSKAEPTKVRVGINCMEFISTKYNLQISADGQIVREWNGIQLAPGEKWETTLTIPMDSSSARMVEALLYRLDAPKIVYRRVTLWRDP